jgi:hypothetical protein
MAIAFGVLAYIVVAYLVLVFVTVPLTLLAVPVGVAVGTLIAAIGHLREYSGQESGTPVVRPGTLGRRGSRAPHPQWDQAWPSYLTVQLDRDLKAALGMPRRLLARQYRWIFARVREEEVLPWVLFFAPLLLLPGIAFYLGLTGAVFAAWAAIALVLEAVLVVPRLMVAAVIGGLRGWDWLIRWWRGAATMCFHCGWIGTLPAFKCPQCGVSHHDLRPGLLGAVERRCHCDCRLPTTIVRAAARQLAPQCPGCARNLPELTLVKPSARVAFAGPPSSGTSSLIRAAAEGLHTSGDVRLATQPGDLLRVTTACCDDAFGTRYVSLLDLDGKQFTRDPDPPQLWELRTTRRHVLMVDGVRLPYVRDLNGSSNSETLGVELAYRILVAQLHRYGGRVGRCALAVVVSKADLLMEVDDSVSDPATGHSSDRVRDWLAGHGLENLVLAAERDFGSVAYFLTSTRTGAGDARWSPPERPIAWLLGRHRHGAGLA